MNEKWNRKELKSNAKFSVKQNYWRTVLVCIILAVFVGAHVTIMTNISGGSEIPTRLSTQSNSDTLNEILGHLKLPGTKEIDKAINEAEKIEDKVKQEEDNIKTQLTSARKGVAAGLFDSITKSDSFILGILNALNKGIFHGKVMEGIIIGIGAFIMLLYWMFIGNILRIGEYRFFMENQFYHHTQVNRILFLFKIGRVKNSAIIMLWKRIYLLLWSLTIVGVFIKMYSYKMVPFILAENPDAPRKEVFTLSRKMMNGYKWSAFVFDMSFILWNALSACTFGIASYLYVSPYKTAADTELYMFIRKQAKSQELPHSELLNDSNLNVPAVPMNEYPIELFPIPEKPGRVWLSVDYHRHYSIVNLFLMFILFSMIGWMWEVSLHLFKDGIFVNRGVLMGPWLPIYGAGGVMVLVFAKRWLDKPALAFAVIIVMCGMVEYSTSWYLETFLGAKWWDYSGYLLNLNGRICLEGLTVFGIMGCLIAYFLAPMVDQLLNKIPQKLKYTLCALLLALFVTDLVHAHFHPNMGKGITDYHSK